MRDALEIVWDAHGLRVWRVDLDADATRTAAWLAADERARIARYARPEDRRRASALRGALRGLLGAELGADPAAMRFAYSAHGKPELPRAAVAFNVSRSQGIGLVAVRRGGAVGVDVEVVRPLPDLAAVSAQVHGRTELARWAALPAAAQLAAFYATWTRKEAIVKCLGVGLSLPLHAIEVSVGLDVPAAVLRVDGHAPLALVTPLRDAGLAACVAITAHATMGDAP